MPSNQGQVPEEAVEAAGAEASRLHHFRPYDHITRTIIETAAPALRKQFAEELAGEFEERAKDMFPTRVTLRQSYFDCVDLTRKWATRDVVGEASRG